MNSPETNSSLLFYIQKATCSVSKYQQETSQYEFKAEINQVDLYVASYDVELSNYWIQTHPITTFQAIDSSLHNQIEVSREFKRIIQDFSFIIVSISNDGVLPQTKVFLDTKKKNDVDSVSLSIPQFRARMTGEQFYTALNVIRYVLLVNPTNVNRDVDKDTIDPDTLDDAEALNKQLNSQNDHYSDTNSTTTMNTTSRLRRNNNLKKELKDIENEVYHHLHQENNTNNNIPFIRITYIMDTFEWILLDPSDQEIAIATITKFSGEHIFCYEGASENKITVHNIQVINPSPGQQEYQKWKDPKTILSSQLLDREMSEKTNMIEVIANIKNTLQVKNRKISIVEHVGINVYPGTYYYVLFQLSTSIAGRLRDYFFPNSEDTDELDMNMPISPRSTQSSITESTSTYSDYRRWNTPDTNCYDYIDENNFYDAYYNQNTKNKLTYKNSDLSLSPTAQEQENETQKVYCFPFPSTLQNQTKPKKISTYEVSFPAIQYSLNPFDTNEENQTSTSPFAAATQNPDSTVGNDPASSSSMGLHLTRSTESKLQKQQQENAIKNCQHQFVVCKKPGKCYICKQKIYELRNPGYSCLNCGILVHPDCRDAALNKAKKPVKKTTNELYTIWFQHVRVGKINMIINTRGFPVNCKNFEFSMTPFVLSETMSSWSGLFNKIKRSIVSTVCILQKKYDSY